MNVAERDRQLGDPRFAFVVGAPRSGTTALSKYLRKHPGVCFSSPKEPHYFARFDLRGDPKAAAAQVARDYLPRYFAHCEGDGRLRAEGSVTYLYVPEQMRPVVELWPQAKFVICVRDPLQLLPSLHQRLLYLGDETVTSFEKAWALRHRRARGQAIPRSCVEPRWLRYDEAGYLGQAAERFFAEVGRERCHVVVFDDLARDPGGEYRRLLAFLGLPNDGRTRFESVRSGQGFRFGWLQRLLKRPPVLTQRAVGKAARQHYGEVDGVGPNKKKRPSRISAARKRLLEWNSAPAPRAKLSPAVRREIRDLYADDIDKLGRLLGRDLSHWLGRGGPTGADEPSAARVTRR